jgi:hypothetical protein
MLQAGMSRQWLSQAQLLAIQARWGIGMARLNWPVMNLRAASALGASVAALCGASVAFAQQETTTYTYDALGRLTQVQKSGGPADGTTSVYNYDAASNRTNVTVTGSPNGSGNGSSGNGAGVSTTYYAVVPLNGYTIIAYTK